MSKTTENKKPSASTVHSRHNVLRIKCTGKESLRRRIGLPIGIDTKGELLCVTNDNETFHAAIKTKVMPRMEIPTLVYVI